jgi:hypothetical protein
MSPVNDLDTVGEDLGTSALLGDDRRGAALHRSEWRDTEGLAHRRHDIDIRVFEALIYLLPSRMKPGKWNRSAMPRSAAKLAHGVHHIA